MSALAVPLVILGRGVTSRKSPVPLQHQPGERGNAGCSPIWNFAYVTPSIWRSGTPDRAGYLWLLKAGVRTIVDLREGEAADLPPELEGRIDFRRVPVPDYSPPTFAQVRECLRLMKRPDALPILVCCWGGGGRTGTVIACYRVTTGWSADQALAEADRFVRNGRLCRPQREFIREFARIWREEQRSGKEEPYAMAR